MVRTIRRSYFGVFAMLVAMVLLCVLADTSGAAAGDTIRVSVDSSGNQADEGPAGQGSYEASISANGRHVVFYSYASDLVEGDTNGRGDIFVRDRDTDADGVFDEPGFVSTERVSVSSSGNQGNGSSSTPSISSDGRFVVFVSEAQNLVEGDIAYRDVFVRDRDADEDGVFDEVNEPDKPKAVSTEKVTKTGGIDVNQAPPSISSDGRYVAFTSNASNVVEGDTDTNNAYDVFVHDRTTATTERVSVGLDVSGSGTDADGGSDDASISSNGDYVVFRSSASNLVENDFNGEADIFVRDLQSSTTQLVSIDSSGNQANDFSAWPSISSDGRYVAFLSYASNLVGGDTNGIGDVFVHDRQTGTTERASVDSSGTQAIHPFGWPPSGPSISAEGRYVAFNSSAPNLVGGDTNGLSDTFVHDRQTGTTQQVSVSSSGMSQASGNSLNSPSISAEGRFAAFYSNASDLVAGDTNGFVDVFLHERGTIQPGDPIAPTTTASATTSSGAAYQPGTLTNKDVKVTFSAQDNQDGSGIKEIRYSATGAQSIPETVYNPQNPPVINTEGTTIISYFATDNAGNQESPAKTLTVKLDKSAPDSTIVSGPSGTVSSTSASFSFSSSEPNSTFECSLDGSTFASCTSPKSYSGLADGSHTFEVRAIDAAGNTDASAASSTWMVAASPDTTIGSGPSGNVKSTSATFSFSSSKAGSTFQCSRDGAAFAACTSPKSYSSLTQGSHTFRVRAIDKAGNIDASPASRSWFVDTVGPKGTISINGGASSTSSRSVTLRLAASDPSPASGVDSMRFRNGGTTTWSSWLDYSSSAPWTLTAGAGKKTVYVQYRDRAGNISASASDTITFSS
jgi:Tol biopolymer transport system component